MSIIAITVHGGIRLAEVGFALSAIAGAAILLGAVVAGFQRMGALVGGAGLAAGSILLIIALHWGHFGLG